MPDLDETITEGQTGHVTDHEALADLYNKLAGTDTAGGLTLLQALLDGTYVTPSSTATLTNKTIDDFSNTVEADTIHVQVRNSSGSTIAKGVPVYITGYNVGQDLIEVAPADASSSATMPAIGITEASISNNASGPVNRAGRLAGVDTSAFSVGAELYVSETAGALTTSRPVAPALAQLLGTVVRSHASLGVIEVLAGSSIPAASETGAGVVELATAAEVAAGTDALRVVTPATLSGTYAADWTRPTGALGQTFARNLAGTNLSPLASGRLQLYGIHLLAGEANSITFFSGATPLATGSNQWFSLYDASRNLLAVTADDTSTAWGANTAKTLNLSAPYEVPATGRYYVGICVVASTVPSLRGQAGFFTAANGVAPVLAGSSNTGLTNPASAPDPANALSAQSEVPYAYVS